MDGVRGYWNGLILISKNGNEIHCPKWFTEQLPSTTSFDGELWMGRDNTFSDIASILNSKNGDWKQLGYYIFDIPSSIDTYEVRMKEMESLKLVLPAHVHIVENIQCTGNEHLNRHLLSVVTGKGEGLMLRKPQTANQKGYTSSILKVKVKESLYLCSTMYRSMKTRKWRCLVLLMEAFCVNSKQPITLTFTNLG